MISHRVHATLTQAVVPGFLAILLACLCLPASANVTPPFETPPTLRASDLLPEYLLSSDVHEVADSVQNDGTTNQYTITSPFGDTTASGREALENTIQELRALALLQETRKRTGAAMGFNQGLKKVVTSPYRSVKRVVFNPLYAVEAVPSEIADYAGKIATVSDLFKYGPKVFIRRSLGIDGARKDLARRLHVDMDTDNEALRDEIRRVGWGVWWGGLVPDVGEGYLDLSIDLSTEVGDIGNGNLGRAVDALRREVFPRSARRMMKKMDVPKDVNKSFRKHPHYDGGMREDLAEALLTMEDTENREAFILWAKTVPDERSARGVVRLAQVIAVSHATEEPFSNMLTHEEGGLVLHTESGDAIAPLVHDYLIWNETAAEALANAERLNAEEKPLAVWSLGQFSDTLQTVIDARGYTARAQVARTLPRFEVPPKGLDKLEQRYEERVEEPTRRCFLMRFRPDRKQRLLLEPLGTPAGANE